MRFYILFFSEILGKECLNEGEIHYHGKQSTTENGLTCQRWDQNYPHRIKYRPDDRHNNYCRNPDGDVKGPWCYTIRDGKLNKK